MQTETAIMDRSNIQNKSKLARIRYCEMFMSVQGEGRFVGVPSVFFRTFGCNFECAGFGQPRGNQIPKEEMPYMTQDLTDIKHISELPVVDIGCDSSASWSARYKHLVEWNTVDVIANKLTAMAPGGDWISPSGQDTHLVITGGEPMMWQKQFIELFKQPAMKTIKNITFETNTTYSLKGEFNEFIRQLVEGRITNEKVHVTWSCSPKLTISGESWSDAIRPDVARMYYNIPNSHLYFKFVVADDKDFDEVGQAVREYEEAGIKCDVFCMAVGATVEGQAKTSQQVAGLCIKYGYKYSPRLHVDLFGNRWGT